MESKFSWRNGTSFPVKAQVAADTIRDLQRSLGKETITARELLDASRDENAPLHSCFEWDDTVAAELYRTEQARRIIHSIEVRIIKDDKPPLKTRFMLNIQPIGSREKGEFVAVNIAMRNENYRERILNNALSELRSFQRKYADFNEMAGIFTAIDSFAAAIA